MDWYDNILKFSFYKMTNSQKLIYKENKIKNYLYI